MLAWGCVSTALAASCGGDSGSPLVVMGVLAPPTSSGEQCVYPSLATGPFLSRGTMDVSLTTQYRAVVLLGNTAREQVSDSRLDIDESPVDVIDATVADYLPGGTLLDTFTAPTTALVTSAGANGPGLAASEVEIVSPAAARQLGGPGSIEAWVRVFGTRLGVQVESSWVAFTVDVCDGCLVTCPSAPTVPVAPPPCIVGQDQPIDCRSCAALGAECGP